MIGWFVVVGFLTALVGLVILLITQAQLVWEELTPQELEALRRVVRPEPEAEMVFNGFDVVVSSRWSWLASRLFPGVLLVDARVNEWDLALVMDSGIDIEEPLLLYAEAARATNVRIVSEAPSMDVPERDRQFPAYRGVADRLELGKLVLRQVPVRVVAARHRVRSLGLPLFQVDGFLGLSFLERFAVSWDFQHQRLELRRHSVERLGSAVPLQAAEREHEGKRSRFYFVEGFLNGEGPYQVLIDTGASTPMLLVSGRIAQVHGKGQDRFRVRRFQIGEIVLEDLPAFNIEVLLGRELPVDMLLGTGLLRVQGFKHLTLDFLAGKLYAER